MASDPIDATIDDARIAARPTRSLGLIGDAFSRHWFYGWFIAVAGGISMFSFTGVTVFGLAAVYRPIHDDLGWSMAAITAGVSIRSFQNGLLAPFLGNI